MIWAEAPPDEAAAISKTSATSMTVRGIGTPYSWEPLNNWRQCYADPQTPIWPVFLPDGLVLLHRRSMSPGKLTLTNPPKKQYPDGALGA
jgi:hypothetical protein